MASTRRPRTPSGGVLFPLSMPGDGSLELIQGVPQLVPLGTQVLEIVEVRLGAERDLIDDVQPVAVEAGDLLRIVGEEPHPPDPQVLEDLGPQAVLPEV